MALAAMIKPDQEPKKTTLPTVTVTGVRKKSLMKAPIKGKKTFGVIWKNGDTTTMDEQSMKNIMYKKQ